MTEKEIWRRAMEQSAVDLGCSPFDFEKPENVIVVSRKAENARKYLTLPFDCNLVSYGSNVVASVREDLQETVGKYLSRYKMEHCFETPNMHMLDNELQKQGMRICF